MATSVFFDGVRNIRVVNGMVRVECVSVAAAKDETGTAGVQAFTHEATLVTTLAGFIQLFNSMETLVEKLSETGAIADRRGRERDAGA